MNVMRIFGPKAIEIGTNLQEQFLYNCQFFELDLLVASQIRRQN